jgi:hypothetical protein
VIKVRSHLPVEQQLRAVSPTWLDRQFIQGTSEIGDRGFGAEVRAALRQRIDFLVAERRAGRVLLSRNPLSILSKRPASLSITHNYSIGIRYLRNCLAVISRR